MATERVRLGHMVICAGFRNPALTAKLASTIDVISGGRFELGIGAGWKEDEWLAYGYGFPTIAERMHALGDDLEVIRAMLEPGRATYDGEYASVRGAINVPKGVQEPRIPIIVGGNGARRDAPATPIRYADELNYVFLRADEIAPRIADVRARCETEGRDPATLRFSLYARDEELREAGPAAGGRPRRARRDRARSPGVLPDPLVTDARGAGGLRRGLPGRGTDAGGLNRAPVWRAPQPARGIRPRRRSGAYRNQARPTSSSSGTGPYWRESIGSPKPAAAVTSGVASLTSQASSSASSRYPSANGTLSPGPAATRLTASVSSSGSRKTTTVPRRGQWSIVGSTSSQSPSAMAGDMLASATAIRHGPRTRSRSGVVRRGRRSDELPRRTVRAGRYFLVAQKISPNSLTAASSCAAASASTLCLFLLASLRIFQTLSWRSG